MNDFLHFKIRNLVHFEDDGNQIRELIHYFKKVFFFLDFIFLRLNDLRSKNYAFYVIIQNNIIRVYRHKKVVI